MARYENQSAFKTEEKALEIVKKNLCDVERLWIKYLACITLQVV